MTLKSTSHNQALTQSQYSKIKYTCDNLYKKKNLYGKCVPRFFLYNNHGCTVVLKFLAH